MKQRCLIPRAVVLATAICLQSLAHAKPTFVEESLENYTARMAWFAEAQYGMFIHWGLYAIPAGEWRGEAMQKMKYSEWIQAAMDIPREDYAELIHRFNPVEFDADLIVRTAKAAGMKYLVITSKHHDGFCLWDSQYGEFDIASTPFKGRDPLAELNAACQEHGLKFGLYYSIIDWNHHTQEPNFASEKKHPMHTWGKPLISEAGKSEYIEYMTHQVLELIENYDPAILWFDADWTPWWGVDEGIELYNTIRAASPTVIVNNRVGPRGHFQCDYVCTEQNHFKDAFPRYWEACYTMNKSWGYKRDDDAWKTAETVYNKLKDINAKGGNLLLNVGPDARGVVQPEAIQILLETGKLLEANPIEKAIPTIRAVPGLKNKPRTELIPSLRETGK